MKLLVTGASGFLGQYVVAQALRQGHHVRALVRPSSVQNPLSWSNHPALELVGVDLRQKQGLVEVLDTIDVVIHLAAVKAGDFQSQLEGTVSTTENLLEAMVKANRRRLIGISTFSVFDYLHIHSGDIINEESPIESNPSQRDGYAQTKLMQEQLYRDFAQNQGGQVTILRPGMVYGRDNLWNAHLGAQLGDNLWLRIGNHATIPLTYVENCAEAIVAAAQSDQIIGETINIVDDDLPSQQTYAHQLMKRMDSPPRTIPINWTVMQLVANTAWAINSYLLKGKVKLPGILVPAKLQARFKPLHYSNTRAKHQLNWTPRYSLDTALDRSCNPMELRTVPHQTPPVIEELN